MTLQTLRKGEITLEDAIEAKHEQTIRHRRTDKARSQILSLLKRQRFLKSRFKDSVMDFAKKLVNDGYDPQIISEIQKITLDNIPELGERVRRILKRNNLINGYEGICDERIEELKREAKEKIEEKMNREE